MENPRATLLGDEPQHLNEAQRWLASALEVIGYRFDPPTTDGNGDPQDLITGFHWDTPGGDYIAGDDRTEAITTSHGTRTRTLTGDEATTYDRNRHAAFTILEQHRDDPYAFEAGLLPCAHCGALTYYGNDDWYHHLDPAEPVCFLTSADPDTGDGDPSAPGGLGCPTCDTLWATADSLEQHLLDSHGTTYDEATNAPGHLVTARVRVWAASAAAARDYVAGALEVGLEGADGALDFNVEVVE